MAAGHQKDRDQKLRCFSPIPHPPEQGEGLSNNPSYLHEEPSIKILKVSGLESFQIGEHMEGLGK